MAQVLRQNRALINLLLFYVFIMKAIPFKNLSFSFTRVFSLPEATRSTMQDTGGWFMWRERDGAVGATHTRTHARAVAMSDKSLVSVDTSSCSQTLVCISAVKPD